MVEREFARRAGNIPAVLLATALGILGSQPARPHLRPEEFITVPGGESPDVPNDAGRLLVGFGQTDMTSPPGVGLNGAGPAARVSVGWHRHLYARAMVLQDSSGTAVSLVVCDMAHMAVNIQRHVAARLLANGIPLGADRLFITATHSHSAGGNVLDARTWNANVGPLSGFDTAQEEFFVTRIDSAIEMAWRNRAPGRLSVRRGDVPDCTWNRSYNAWALNPEVSPAPAGAPCDPGKDDSVDREWFMLCADTLSASSLNPSREEWVPAGVYSSFSTHATGNSLANDLLDPDLPGYPVRGLAKEIGVRRREQGQSPGNPCVIMACGTEGDVAPLLDGRGNDSDAYHDPARLRPNGRPLGDRAPTAAEANYIAPDNVELIRRLDLARANLDRLGDALTAAACRVYSGPIAASISPSVRIQTAFRTLDLSSPGASYNLCSEPREGVATAAGAEGLRTPLDGWKMFGLIPLGFEEGGRAIDRGHVGCQGAKKLLLGPFLQRLATHSDHEGLPRYAQLMVVNIGPLWICGLPGELTTQVGRRIRHRIQKLTGARFEDVRVLGLTNGYLDYVATAEEYAAQNYEGGSTLYGPQSAAVLEEGIARLARDILDGRSQDPVVPLTLNVGPFRSFFPGAGHFGRKGRPTLEHLEQPTSPSSRHTADSDLCLSFRWHDLPPGPFAPSDGLVVRVIHLRSDQVGSSAPEPLLRAATQDTGDEMATDDTGAIDVRLVRWEKTWAIWQADWRIPPPLSAMHGHYQFQVLGGKRRPDTLSVDFELPLEAGSDLHRAGAKTRKGPGS